MTLVKQIHCSFFNKETWFHLYSKKGCDFTSRSSMQNSTFIFLSVLGALMAVNSLATDVYLPALPTMTEVLGPGAELTISGYLFGFMIAQLVWGPISDSIGRIKPLLIGSALFVVGTIGCATAETMTQLVMWRVFQAIGACVGPMLSRAMVRDRYSLAEAADKLSVLTMIMAAAPIVGPSIGGLIVEVDSWDMIFWAVALVGVFIGVGVLFLPETLPEERRNKAGVKRAFQIYGELLGNWGFMKYTLCVAFFYMAAYAVIAGTPFVYITYYGIPERYFGALFALNVIGVMIMSFFNRGLVPRYTMDTLLRAASLAAFIAVLLLVLFTYTNWVGSIGVIVAVVLMFSTNGIIAACATAAALDMAGDKAGTAAALIGSLQYGSGIVSSAVLAVFFNGTPWPMVWVTVASIVVCLGLAWSKHSPRTHNA